MNKERITHARICAHFVLIKLIFCIKIDTNSKENIFVTCPQTVENKGNTHNIDSMDNTSIFAACGSGKKYKQCCGR